MKTILVALDGSDHSRRALALAIELAHALSTELALVNVEDDRPIADSDRELMRAEYHQQLRSYGSLLPAFVPGGGYAAMDVPASAMVPDAEMRATMSEAILDDAVRDAGKAGIKARKLPKQGDVAKQIVAAADQVEAWFVVMGRRGLNPLKELFLGSVSQRVLHDCRRNVLTVC